MDYRGRGGVRASAKHGSMSENFRQGLPQNRFHVGRIESLTDGIFAIAMTLLVLDLRISRDPTAGDLATQIMRAQPTIYSYVSSFFIAAFFWWSYHRMLQRLSHSDNGLVWWNITFLFFVTMLPFSTHVSGAFAGDRLAVEIYCGNLVALSALLLVQWRHVTSHGLVDPAQRSREGLVAIRFAIVLACYAAGGIVGWFFPIFYFLPFFAIPFFMMALRKVTPTSFT